MGRRWKSGAFDLCKPRSQKSLDAEARFNQAAANGKEDPDALRELVEDHKQTYPQGVDPHHAREHKANGFDHKAHAHPK